MTYWNSIMLSERGQEPSILITLNSIHAHSMWCKINFFDAKHQNNNEMFRMPHCTNIISNQMY